MTYYIKLTAWFSALAVTFLASTSMFVQSMYGLPIVSDLSRPGAFLLAVAALVAFGYVNVKLPKENEK